MNPKSDPVGVESIKITPTLLPKLGTTKHLLHGIKTFITLQKFTKSTSPKSFYALKNVSVLKTLFENLFFGYPNSGGGRVTL